MALIQTAAARTVNMEAAKRSLHRSSASQQQQHTSKRQKRSAEQKLVTAVAMHRDCGDDLPQDSSSLSSDRIAVCRDCSENLTMPVRRKGDNSTPSSPSTAYFGCSTQLLRKVFIGLVTISLALMPLAQCMESTVSGSGGSNTLRHTHNHHAHNKEQQIGQNFVGHSGGGADGHHASSSSNSKNSISSSVSSSHYQSSEETDADMQQPHYARPKRIHQKQQPQNRATPLHHSEHSNNIYNASTPHPAPACNVLCKRYDIKERSLKAIQNRILTKLSMFNRSSDKAKQHKVPLEIIEQFCKTECVGSRCECFPKKTSDEEKEQEKHDAQHMNEPDEEELMQGDDPFPDSLRNRREEMENGSDAREIIEEEDDDYFAITNTVYVFPVKSGESNFDFFSFYGHGENSNLPVKLRKKIF